MRLREVQQHLDEPYGNDGQEILGADDRRLCGVS